MRRFGSAVNAQCDAAERVSCFRKPQGSVIMGRQAYGCHEGDLQATCFIWFEARQKFTLSLVLSVLLLFPSNVTADGMVFDRTSLTPLVPNEQRAIIHYKDGVQSMLIALDLQTENAVWVFPVPGRPDQVTVDVSEVFPKLEGGYDLRRLAKRQRHKDFLWLPLMTQIPLMPLWGPYYLSYKRGHGPGVTKHMDVDKFGIHAEIMSAKSVKDLEAYLAQHGLSVKPERLAPFKDYLSDNYVLVVGWISSPDELSRSLGGNRYQYQKKNPCLFVRFPSEKVYYPLKTTAGYGDAVIPVTLQILGLQTVDYPPLTRSVAVHPAKQEDDSYAVYYLRGSASTDNGPTKQSSRTPIMAIEDKKKGPIEEFMQQVSVERPYYTLVTIKARAALFSQDLQALDQVPEDVRRAVAYLDTPPHPLLIVLWTAGLSVASGALAGLLLFRRLRPYAILGLFNLLSLLGLAIAVRVYHRRKGKAPRTIRFVLIYAIVFHVLVYTLFGAFPSL
jgi:hypothetical protein